MMMQSLMAASSHVFLRENTWKKEDDEKTCLSHLPFIQCIILHLIDLNLLLNEIRVVLLA